MEREIFDHNSQFIYCPHCAEKIARHVVTCPKCRQEVLKASRLPMIGLIVAIAATVVFIVGILAAVSIPAYQQYQKKAEAWKSEIEEKKPAIDRQNQTTLQEKTTNEKL